MLSSVPACVGEAAEPPPSIAEKAPAEAAEVSTQTVCEYAERCGRITISCADCAEGEACGGCYAEHYEVDFDACAADIGPDLQVGFACEEQPVTPEEEALVDACLQALVDRECPTVDEALAWVNGSGGEDPRAPQACDVLEHIRFRCYDYDSTDGPDKPAEPIPQ